MMLFTSPRTAHASQPAHPGLVSGYFPTALSSRASRHARDAKATVPSKSQQPPRTTKPPFPSGSLHPGGAGEARGSPAGGRVLWRHGKHPGRVIPTPCVTPSPRCRADPVLRMKAGSTLVPLVPGSEGIRQGAARHKSAPAARSQLQEPNSHILHGRVGAEKLPAVTGNPGNSPNTSWPLGLLPR